MTQVTFLDSFTTDLRKLNLNLKFKRLKSKNLIRVEQIGNLGQVSHEAGSVGSMRGEIQQLIYV